MKLLWWNAIAPPVTTPSWFRMTLFPTMETLVVPQTSKWHQYAEDGWYAEREARCEEVLAAFLNGEKARTP